VKCSGQVACVILLRRPAVDQEELDAFSLGQLGVKNQVVRRDRKAECLGDAQFFIWNGWLSAEECFNQLLEMKFNDFILI
jgi:hypothetical protein